MPSSRCCGHHWGFHSFPTRRSSDLAPKSNVWLQSFVIGSSGAATNVSCVPDSIKRVPPSERSLRVPPSIVPVNRAPRSRVLWTVVLDRKSTRLNSSHTVNSYAVFSLLRSPLGFPLFPYTTLFRSRAKIKRLAPIVCDRFVRRGDKCELCSRLHQTSSAKRTKP